MEPQDVQYSPCLFPVVASNNPRHDLALRHEVDRHAYRDNRIAGEETPIEDAR
jgi:hypothetical protein